MTREPTPCLREPRAILSRLLVLLALVLFGVPQGHSDGTLTNAGPVAHSQVEQAQGIISAQRLLMRAQKVDDDSPETATPGNTTEARQARVVATMSYAPQPSFRPLAIRILPPVRGPPAA